MADITKPRLTYFSSRGLAENIRIILAETNTDYDDIGFQTVDGKTPELVKMQTDGTLLFNQVPLWQEPGGFSLVQSNAIIRHLARTKGLYGKNEHEMSLCDSIHEYIVDLRQSVNATVRLPDDKKEEGKKNFLEVVVPKCLAKFEQILKTNNTGHLVGAQLTFIDLVAWYILENYTDQGLLDVSPYPHVAKFKAAIESRPNIAKYRSNPKRHPVQHIFPRFVIYCYPESKNVLKSLVAGEFGGIKIEYPKFTFGVDNKTEEFKKKNPNGEVPVLEGPDGMVWESNAIAKYIARKGKDKGLYGANDFEASQIDQWIEWSRSKLEGNYSSIMYPIWGIRAFDQTKYDETRKSLTDALHVLENHLGNRDWIVGNRTTLADIVMFCTIYEPLMECLEPEYVSPHPKFVAWVNRCAALKEVSAHLKFSWSKQQKLSK